MVKVALIGCGGMAESHAQRFASVKEKIEVVAVVDIDSTKAEKMSSALGGVSYATDYREILDKVDAVLVVLPHHLHTPVARYCMEQGKDVLLEKPMANTEEECLELMDVAERTGRILMIAYPMRYHPMVIRLKALLDQRTYGDVFSLSIWTEQFTAYPPDHWGSSAVTLGGGQLFSHGCHYVDLFLWMFGRPESGSHLGTNYGTPWMEKEGTSHLILSFPKGIVGYHFGTWGARGTKLRYAIHAHCTGGMLEADFGKGSITLHRDAGADIENVSRSDDHREFLGLDATESIIFQCGSGKHIDGELLHFAHCVETRTRPETDPASSLEGLRVIWKLYEAERAGVVAEFEDLTIAGASKKGEGYVASR